jgi:selenide,water dikinase
VHALTDITGFGLAGHTLELARGAKLRAVVDWSKVPLLDGVQGLAEQGFITGASGRNWDAYGKDIELGKGLPETAQALLSDPQTSGGLLVSCAPEAVDAVLALFAREGFADAAVVGHMEAGAAGLRVDAGGMVR